MIYFVCTRTKSIKMAERRVKKYLNNKDIKHQLELSFAQGRMTEELGKMFLMLVENIGKKGNYSGYSYLDEMKGVAIITLCRGWNKFNMIYDNPFAYFTSFVNNAFNHVLKIEKQQRNMKNAMMVDAGLNPANSFSNDDYDDTRGSTMSYQSSNSGCPTDFDDRQGFNDINYDDIPAPSAEDLMLINDEKVAWGITD